LVYFIDDFKEAVLIMTENEREENIKELIKAMEALPEEAQAAFCCVIANMKAVKEMCRNPGMTEEEIERRIEQAKAGGDYFSWSLLTLSLLYMEGEDEAEENETADEGALSGN